MTFQLNLKISQIGLECSGALLSLLFFWAIFSKECLTFAQNVQKCGFGHMNWLHIAHVATPSDFCLALWQMSNINIEQKIILTMDFPHLLGNPPADTMKPFFLFYFSHLIQKKKEKHVYKTNTLIHVSFTDARLPLEQT